MHYNVKHIKHFKVSQVQYSLLLLLMQNYQLLVVLQSFGSQHIVSPNKQECWNDI